MTYRIISQTLYGNTTLSYQRVNEDGSMCHFFEESPEYELYQFWLDQGNTPETVQL